MSHAYTPTAAACITAQSEPSPDYAVSTSWYGAQMIEQSASARVSIQCAPSNRIADYLRVPSGTVLYGHFDIICRHKSDNIRRAVYRVSIRGYLYNDDKTAFEWRQTVELPDTVTYSMTRAIERARIIGMATLAEMACRNE